MKWNRETEGGDGVLELVRQTADDVAALVGKHLKLARLEVSEDLVKLASRARMMVVLGVLLAVGYALAMAGLAVLFGGNRRVGVPLLIVGGAHLEIFGVWMVLAVRRLGGMHLMDDSSREVQRSFDAVGLSGRSVNAT